MSSREQLGRFLDSALKPEPWCIDSVVYEGGLLDVSGWALAPDGRQGEVTFTLNDRQFEVIDFPIFRPDLAELFWYKAGADKAAFRCRTRISPSELFKSGYAELKYTQRSTGRPLSDDHNYYFADEPEGIPLPEPNRRKRVTGSEQAGTFRLEGFTTFRKLDLALQRFRGKGLSDFRNILDWGCGCGRVSRYFTRLGPRSFTGADIDADNLGWCRENLPLGKFQQFPLHPPTPVPPSSFDLAVGISVFSHLRKADHLEWLAELERLMSPGGVLLLTVLGQAAVCRTHCDLRFVEGWERSGFVSIANNVDLKGYIEDDSYYVTALMTEDYIRKTWSRFFVIDGIIPATIGNQQDLVVLHKAP